MFQFLSFLVASPAIGFRAEDAAESREQRVFVVVGQPHPDQAIQMARTEPCRYFFRTTCNRAIHLRPYIFMSYFKELKGVNYPLA